MKEFAENGGVAPEDKNMFIAHSDLDFLRSHVVNGEYWFKYRHKTPPVLYYIIFTLMMIFVIPPLILVRLF